MTKRLRKDEADDRPEINGNGDGALFFVVAETSSNIDDLGDFTPTSMELKRLFPPVPAIDYTRDITLDPLLLLLVSTGMTLHHYVVHGFDLDIPPFIDLTILRAGDPPTPTFEPIEYHLPPSMKTLNKPQNPKRILTPPPSIAMLKKITREQYNIIKAKSGEKEEGGSTVNYNSYEVLTGNIWRCSCKARGLPDDQET
ncbi:hypothetical protein NE237_026083 [Protea cynaroides]|uniref:Uncharacterized protein n=1 Tax=Protea cynaroides TaxID=273540 RepID=A0A9Q0H333_9MAGN|nr:hypothetical protein NE237_026083 [Protea cynaroides]